MTSRETAGRDGKGEDGRARTREVKLGVFFTQDKVNDEGYPVRDKDSASWSVLAPGGLIGRSFCGLELFPIREQHLGPDRAGHTWDAAEVLIEPHEHHCRSQSEDRPEPWWSVNRRVSPRWFEPNTCHHQRKTAFEQRRRGQGLILPSAVMCGLGASVCRHPCPYVPKIAAGSVIEAVRPARGGAAARADGTACGLSC